MADYVREGLGFIFGSRPTVVPRLVWLKSKIESCSEPSSSAAKWRYNAFVRCLYIQRRSEVAVLIVQHTEHTDTTYYTTYATTGAQ